MEINKFIRDTEENRGFFKNQDKVYAQLSNIYYNGIKEIKELCTNSKVCGISLLEDIASSLTREEQKELIDRVFTSNKVNVDTIRIILNDIKLRS